MPDQLKIDVVTNDAALQKLIDLANSGQGTFQALGKGFRDVRNNAIAGSESFIQASQALDQFSKQTRAATGVQSEFMSVLKSSRQEHRIGMYAVLEGMHAIEGFTGKENEMAKAVSGGAQAFFGIKFAMDMAGGSLAAFSLPVALLIAAFSILKTLWDENKQKVKELNDELQKQYEIELKLGLISPENQRAKLQKDINDATADYTLLLAKRNGLENDLAKMKELTGGEEATEMIAVHGMLTKVNAELVKQKTKVEETELAYKTFYDTQQKESKKTTDQSSKDYAVKLEQHDKLVDWLWQENKLSYDDYELELKKRDLRAVRENQELLHLQIQKQLFELHNNPSYQEAEMQPLETGLPKTNLGVNIKSPGMQKPVGLPEYKNDLTIIQKLYGTLAIASNRWNQEFNTTNLLIGSFDQAIGGVANSWTNAISGLIQGTQNIGQAFKAMGAAVVQELETIIARMIAMKILETALGFLGLAGGADVSTNGASLSGAGSMGNVSFAASGTDFVPFGSGRNFIVGEQRPEWLQVFNNGFRIHPTVPSAISQANQMGSSSRGGMAPQFHVNVDNHLTPQGLVTAVTIGKQQWSKIQLGG